MAPAYEPPRGTQIGRVEHSGHSARHTERMRTRTKGRVAVAVAVAVATVSLCPAAVAPAAAQTTPTTAPTNLADALLGLLSGPTTNATPSAPSFPGDFPDPSVLTVGTRSYAYATQAGPLNVQVISSTDLVHWTAPANALPSLPAWADPGSTWAPSVAPNGTRYVMWYTVRHRASGRQCLSIAIANDPGGPFVDNSAAPAVCQLDHGGSIDPDIFVDALGVPYLLWKSDDNAVDRPTHLWGARLNGSYTGLASGAVHLLAQDAAWQGPAVEGPTMVGWGFTYYLFYGANAWDSAAAGIGYAMCASPLGPCSDATTTGPWLGTSGAALGPSGPDVFRDASGALRLAYHAWYGCTGYPSCRRALWMGSLSFPAGRPVLNP